MGRPDFRRSAAAVLSLALGARAATRARPRARRRPARRLSRRRRRLRDQAERQRRPRAARLRLRASGRARPASHRAARRRRRCCSAPSAAGSTACARSSPTRAARTRPPARRGLDDAAKTQGAAALAAGVAPDEVALASTGGISHYLPVENVLRGILDAQRQLRRDGDGDFQQAIQTTDALREARQPRGRAVHGHGARLRPVQGRGNDLAALRHDALLRADRCRLLQRADRRSAARCVRQALVRPRLGRRPAFHQRHRRS